MVLNLSGNDIEGVIPRGISTMVNLSYLDLSNNELKGRDMFLELEMLALINHLLLRSHSPVNC